MKGTPESLPISNSVQRSKLAMSDGEISQNGNEEKITIKKNESSAFRPLF